MKSPTPQKIYGITLAFIAWLSVIIQFYLNTGSFFNFISYFTILSNLLVAISLTCSTVFQTTKLGNYFSLFTVKSAIALYILIVGLVYNLVLRGIWDPKGLPLIVDNLLHVAVPLLYILHWFVFVPRKVLKWKDGIAWITFPFLYLLYTLIRGHFTKWYPYPFMDVSQLGYVQVFINVSFMIVAFFIVGLLLIGINRSQIKKITN